MGFFASSRNSGFVKPLWTNILTFRHMTLKERFKVLLAVGGFCRVYVLVILGHAGTFHEIEWKLGFFMSVLKF